MAKGEEKQKQKEKRAEVEDVEAGGDDHHACCGCDRPRGQFFFGIFAVVVVAAMIKELGVTLLVKVRPI